MWTILAIQLHMDLYEYDEPDGNSKLLSKTERALLELLDYISCLSESGEHPLTRILVSLFKMSVGSRLHTLLLDSVKRS